MLRIITEIEPKENLFIEAVFSDGEIVRFDVKSMFEKHPIFHALEDEELFRSVRIDGIGYGISWNDDLDLSSDGIYCSGEHVGKTDPNVRAMLGQTIAAAREEKGMSQRQLSRNSGVIQAEISKIEQGRGKPDRHDPAETGESTRKDGCFAVPLNRFSKVFLNRKISP